MTFGYNRIEGLSLTGCCPKEGQCAPKGKVSHLKTNI